MMMRKLFVCSRAPLWILPAFRVRRRKHLSIQGNVIPRINFKSVWLLAQIATGGLVQFQFPLSGIYWFCGKYSCTIACHRRDQVHILPHYWYIQAGPKSMSGFLRRPSYLLTVWEDLLPNCLRLVLRVQLVLYLLDLLLGSGSSYLILGNNIS